MSLPPGRSDTFGIRWNCTLDHESANDVPCERLTPVSAEIHDAFLAIGCCLVCYRRLRNSL
jgi:hypothetical protein